MKSDMLQLIFVCCDVRDLNYTYDTCASLQLLEDPIFNCLICWDFVIVFFYVST